MRGEGFVVTRRFRAGTAVAIADATVLSVAVTTPAGAAGPIKWGASIRPAAGQTQFQAVQGLQTQVGRTLAATRDFLLWDSPFPTAYENSLKAQGTTILLSVATNRLDKSKILWADVAAAKPGDPLYTTMPSWADRVRHF